MRSLFIVAATVTAFTVSTSCGDSTTPSQPSVGPATNPTTTTTSTPAGPQTLRRATFMSANGYVTEGSASIREEDGEVTLELGADFRTSNSPALEVRLCRNEDCTGDHVSLGPLQSFEGRQSYPTDDDATAYDFVTIYCLAVRLPFGYGRLQ